MLLDVEVICQRPGLKRGVLELTFHDGLDQDESSKITRYVSDELAVTETGLRFRMMLPPMTVWSESASIGIVAQFRTVDNEVIKIGERGDHQLRAPAYWKRLLLLAVCTTKDARLDGIGVGAYRALKVEQFDREYNIGRGILTSAVHFEPADIPDDPLEFFAYDMLVLSGEGFAQLNAKQLDAVYRWVEAGGRLLVFAQRSLTEVHKGFLNRLTGKEAGSVFLLDDLGAVVAPEAVPIAQTPLWDVGLGSAVVLRKDLADADLKTAGWRRIVAFLWNIRGGQQAQVEQDGYWTQTSPSEDEALQYGMHSVFEPMSVDNEQQLPELLLLDGHVQKMPAWMVLSILALFLLAIAPGDYYLLGYFKVRKYTWIVFPVTSVAFTFATVALAERHLGHNDHVRSLVIVDLVPGNRAVRTSRFETHFTASQKDVLREVKGSLFADFDPPHLEPDADGRPQRVQTNSAGDQRSRVLIQRRIPQSYSIERTMQQWSSKTTRFTYLGTDVPLPDIDWDGFDKPSLYDPQAAEQVRDEIFRHLPDASFCLSESWQAPTRVAKSSLTVPMKIAALIRSSSARSLRDEMGLFQVIARTAPSGAGSMEDLALLDEKNPRERLLIVAWRAGNDIIVVRRLYRRKEQQPRQPDRNNASPPPTQEQK